VWVCGRGFQTLIPRLSLPRYSPLVPAPARGLSPFVDDSVVAHERPTRRPRAGCPSCEWTENQITTNLMPNFLVLGGFSPITHYPSPRCRRALWSVSVSCLRFMPGGCRRSNLLFGFLMAHLAATKEASEPFLHSRGCILEDAEHFRCDRGGMSSTARVRAATAKEFSHFHTGVYCCTKGNLHTGRLDFLKFSVRSLLSTKQQYPRRAWNCRVGDGRRILVPWAPNYLHLQAPTPNSKLPKGHDLSVFQHNVLSSSTHQATSSKGAGTIPYSAVAKSLVVFVGISNYRSRKPFSQAKN